jgi:hypothetical protein
MRIVIIYIRLHRGTSGVAGVGSYHRARRATFIVWLRKVHGSFGLWGALLGLLFGISGVVLDHRAVMKFPAAQPL